MNARRGRPAEGPGAIARFSSPDRFVRGHRLWTNRQAHRRGGRQDGKRPIFYSSEYLAPARPHSRWLLVLAACLLAACLALSAPAKAASPVFAGEGPLASDTGYLLVQWESDDAVALDIATTPDFAQPRTLYEGRNQSFFVSGLDEGDYHLRLRGANGVASAPLVVEVRHQSLQRALWLTLIGATVTLAVITVILRGERDD